MDTYTAKEITEKLQQEDMDINLRTIRYYTQIGILPPLEAIGNKRVYTEQHVDFIKAIVSLSKTGMALAEIQDKLKDLTLEEIRNIGNKLFLFKEESFLKNETIKVNEDVFLTVSSEVPKELQQEVVRAITKVFEEE